VSDIDLSCARSEALDVVLDTHEWRLAQARWQTIEQILIAMNAAVAAGDAAALLTAIADLELASPLRMTLIGDSPAIPATPPVRALLNTLVHSLGGVPPTPARPAGTAGAEGDDSSGH
jgi:CATRA-associated small protein